MHSSAKSLIKKTICYAALPVAKGLGALGLFPKRVIVKMDGGICSQMHFYLVGDVFRRRGLDVEYDLRWFDRWGKDLNGNDARNFDLLKAFPNLEFKSAAPTPVNRVIQTACTYRNDYFKVESPTGWMNLTAPIYLDGYYRDNDMMYERARELFGIPDASLLSDGSKKVLTGIEKAGRRSVAVHARRGDLSNFLPSYGHPASLEYFKEAARCQNSDADGQCNFFVFSDDPEWSRSVLMPEIEEYGTVRIVDVNGPENGWMDLILISRCHGVITSKGSLGKWGALLRPKPLQDGLVTLCAEIDGPEWKNRFQHSRVL